MREHKPSKILCFLNISAETEIHTVSKTWEKWISEAWFKLWGNTNIAKVWVSYIFCRKQIYKILITWEKWILIVRESDGKTQTFQNNGFCKCFMCRINPCNFQNMEWVNPHVREKVWENTNISKFWISYIFHMKQKSIQFPNHGWIPILRNTYGKIQAIPRFFSSLQI